MLFKGTDNKKHFIEPVRLDERGCKTDVRCFRSKATVVFQTDRIARNIVSDKQRLGVVKRNKVDAVRKVLGI